MQGVEGEYYISWEPACSSVVLAAAVPLGLDSLVIRGDNILVARHWPLASPATAKMIAGRGPQAASFIFVLNGRTLVTFKRLVCHADTVLFLRIGSRRVSSSGPWRRHLPSKYVEELEAQAAFLFSPGYSFSRINSRYEVERKFTFNKCENIWQLSRDFYQLVAVGDVSSFIPEFGDEFQVWDYDSFLYKISKQGEARGYVSFILQSDGLVTVKQKIFKRDAEVRREILQSSVDIQRGDYLSHVRKITGCEAEFVCKFRRKRFDINIESVETGNIFSILFDICRPAGGSSPPLCQCELEYVRTRRLGAPVEFMTEFRALCAYLRGFFAERGLVFNEDKRSKLTHFTNVGE